MPCRSLGTFRTGRFSETKNEFRPETQCNGAREPLQWNANAFAGVEDAKSTREPTR